MQRAPGAVQADARRPRPEVPGRLQDFRPARSRQHPLKEPALAPFAPAWSAVSFPGGRTHNLQETADTWLAHVLYSSHRARQLENGYSGAGKVFSSKDPSRSEQR